MTQIAPKVPRLDKFSLRFTERNFERRFERVMLDQSLTLIRISLCLGALLYATFGILDAYIMAPALWKIWTIRFGLVIPALLAIALSTYSRHFKHASQFLLSCAMLAAGLGVILMTVVGPAPACQWYYAGLIMVVIFSSTAIRLHYTYCLFMSVLLFVVYALSALLLNPLPRDVLISNSFFLVMSIAVGAVTNYIQEYYLRVNYVKTRLLQLESDRSDLLRRRADEASRAKTEFLANMSHELRTPLNAIMGFSEIMTNEMFGRVGSDRYREYAQDIYTSAAHLLSIIGEILDLSKAEAGKLTIDESEFDLGGLTGESLRMLRTQAAARGLRLSLVKPEKPIVLIADKRLVRQLLLNIVSNAIKFTQQGGAIDIAIQTDAATGGCIVTVTDTGIGMTREEAKRSLLPFAQIGSTYSREFPGSGLGLPMVAKIMEAHGGDFRLTSIVGRGTTATAHFPKGRILPQRDRPDPLQSGADPHGAV